ncbi:hypothetical protein ACFQ3N_02285 [Virgibacillus byunsanensis]|uniref:Uncharacterized protein n=1 Tax=Virgibacillus byunsanensis TaxID=570945 RepID=A0ABW3LFS5_9BACI
MSFFSKDVENELLEALDRKDEVMFIVNGKLISIEAENKPLKSKKAESLANQIEKNPELKASLNRYIKNPNMQKYTKDELKGIRHARRE